MKCEQVRSRYSPLLEGDLTEEDRDRVESHLGACAPCAERYERFVDGFTGMRDLPRHPVPRSFTAAVLERVEADRPGEAPSRFPWAAVSRWAAGILLGITVSAVWMELSKSPNSPQSTLDHSHLVRQLVLLNERFGEQEARIEARIEGRLEALQNQQRVSGRELTQLGTQLGTLGQELEQDREVQSAANRALVETVQDRLVAAEWSARTWQEGADSRMKRLEQSVVEVARRGSLPLRGPNDPSPILPPSVLASRAERVNDSKAIEVYIDEDDVLVWRPNTSHPNYIAELFEIYDAGHPQVSRQALDDLDELFSTVTDDPRSQRRFSDVVEGILGSENDDEVTDPASEEQRRVEVYRHYWNEHLRTKKKGRNQP